MDLDEDREMERYIEEHRAEWEYEAQQGDALIRMKGLSLVEWVDSRGVSANWQLVDQAKDYGVCDMQSVGWIVRETDEQICVVPHVGIEDDGEHQCCGEMHIPKSCIKNVTPLTWAVSTFASPDVNKWMMTKSELAQRDEFIRPPTKEGQPR